MRINHNLQALNNYGQQSLTAENLARTLEKLSSGNRMNSAADTVPTISPAEQIQRMQKTTIPPTPANSPATTVTISAEGKALQERLKVERESTSETRISNADMAQEMMSYTKGLIMQQARDAMLMQANNAPQMILQLLGSRQHKPE